MLLRYSIVNLDELHLVAVTAGGTLTTRMVTRESGAETSKNSEDAKEAKK